MPSEIEFLTLDEILAIHELVLTVGGGDPGVRDLGLLESALFRPRTGYYEDEVQTAAALMESLLINHPFLDGNKRTAFVATDTFLRINGHRLVLETDPAYDAVTGAIANSETRFHSIAAWIRDCSQPL